MIKNLIKEKKDIILLVLLGVLIRLIFSLLITHIFDFRNILTLIKSVATTGNLSDGFFEVRKIGIDAQLYGKIYYQIGSLWLIFLNKVGILDSHFFQELFNWEIPLYQLIYIKLLQFFYDFLLLFFLYKIAVLLKIKNKNWLIVFF